MSKNNSKTPADPPSFVIRAGMIQPCDVLLSFGGGKMSRMIVALTGSSKIRDPKNGYSHAALCVSTSYTYESDGGLIGSRPIYPLAYDLNAEDEQAQLSLAPGDPLHFQLFRHPQMEHQSKAKVEAAEEKLRNGTFGANYSKLSRLATIAKASPVQKSLILFYSKARDAATLQRAVHSLFCSELVATFFQHLGLQLFSDNRQPHLATPNDLADSKQCFLRVVKGAVIPWPSKVKLTAVDTKTNPVWVVNPPNQQCPAAIIVHASRLRTRNWRLLLAGLKKAAKK